MCSSDLIAHPVPVRVAGVVRPVMAESRIAVPAGGDGTQQVGGAGEGGARARHGAAAADAARQGWHLVSDTAWIGHEDMASRVMQGYATLTAEIIDQLGPEARPTHVFLQAGVGGLAAAVAGPLWEAWGAARPRVLRRFRSWRDHAYQCAHGGAFRAGRERRPTRQSRLCQ